MFWIKVVDIIKTHILCSVMFFRKSHHLWDNVEKYSGERGGATYDVTIWRIRVACWITKATCAYAHAHAHAHGYPDALTRAHARTHRPTSNTFCFSTATTISERLNVWVCGQDILSAVPVLKSPGFCRWRSGANCSWCKDDFRTKFSALPNVCVPSRQPVAHCKYFLVKILACQPVVLADILLDSQRIWANSNTFIF